MNRGRVERPRGPRIALLGAPTPDGCRVRAALAEQKVPGDRIDLYGATSGDVILSDYDGEPRVVQEPDLDVIAAHDVIFICEAGEIAEQIPAVARPDALVIDLIDCLPDRFPRSRVQLDVNPDAASFARPQSMSMNK